MDKVNSGRTADDEGTKDVDEIFEKMNENSSGRADKTESGKTRHPGESKSDQQLTIEAMVYPTPGILGIRRPSNI